MVCSGVWDRFFERQRLHDVIVVVAGIEQVASVVMFDQDGIAREAKLAARSPVPERVKSVDHQGSSIEQVDFGIGHCSVSFVRSGQDGPQRQRAPRW